MTGWVLAIDVMVGRGPVLDDHRQFGAERTAEAERSHGAAMGAPERRRQFGVVLGIGAVVDLVGGHGAPASARQNIAVSHYSELKNDYGLKS
jgi:hypothetical protein